MDKKTVRLAVCALAGAVVFGTIALIALYYSFSPRDNPDLVQQHLFRRLKGLPEPNPLLKVENVGGKEVSFLSNGKKLDAWYYEIPGSRRVALLSHSAGVNNSFWTNKVAALLACKCSVLIYDYQGYGLSEGEPTPAGIIEDGLAAYDFLVKDLHYKPEQIVGYGHSLGAGVTAEILKQRKFAKVVLDAGFTSLREVMYDKAPITKLYSKEMWFTPGLETREALKSPHPPLLLVHGKSDKDIQWHHSQKLYDSAAEPKLLVLLPNSGHNTVDASDQSRYLHELSEFLNH